jgi:serine/threonine protein kinase
MNPERWQQVNKLYHQVMDRNANQRAGFLTRVCGGDEDLRREVQELLAASEHAGGFLVTPAIEIAAKALAADPPTYRLGGQLLHYRILSLLGSGGMGQVYLCQDTRLGRKVAVKVLPGELTQNRERVRRLEQEAFAASALNHPNIITIFEIAEAEGLHFIVTEYIDGQTLRQKMTGSRMQFRELLDIAIQGASALTAAHEAGIVHRDIKPENVMIRRDGYIKVLDFGLAKLIELSSEEPAETITDEASKKPDFRTDPGRLVGTAQYMSPEQVMGLPLDGRSDIFSLGVVIYELITGRAPFEGKTPHEITAAITGREPLPLALYSREIPSELERIVNRTLEKDREERYQVAKDLLLDLKSLKLTLDVEARMQRTSMITPRDDARLEGGTSTREFSGGFQHPTPSRSTPPLSKLEPVGGAVALNSDFYIVRPTDLEFHSAIARRDSVVLVKGPRQAGKTSLLARGLQKARESGNRVVLSDFQNINTACLESVEKLFKTLSQLVAEQLELEVTPDQLWNPHMSPSINFERFLRREVFARVSSPIIWGLDEVDWLFTRHYGSEVFGLFRSWHNKRALDPDGPWHRLTLAIAYATEAHLFISDLNQSPFNVGTRLTLEDFTFEQVEELNQRYGFPLQTSAELVRYYRLVGGHPYLVRGGLHDMAAHGRDLPALEAVSTQDEGPFGDHLRRLLASLQQDPALCEIVREILNGRQSTTREGFYRLRSAGLISGKSAHSVAPRCQLYAMYLEHHLL